MKEQKIISENENSIGMNIRKIRKECGIGQTKLVHRLQIEQIDITRESLVKIERGVQHIKLSQLRGIKKALNTTYDKLLEKTD